MISTSPKTGEPNDAVSKALRALLVLSSHESMRVSDLSAELDVAVSTAHRLLSTLCAYDFAEQDVESRRYRLGPAAAKLGRTRGDDQRLASVAHPHLMHLSAELDETVNLVVLDGSDALFIDGVESRQPMRVATRVGARLPPYATAGGKVLLAHLPDSAIRSRYPGPLRRVTRFTIPSIEQLERELHEVRKLGYALNLGEHLTDVHAMGVPVRAGGTRPVAALTLAGPRTRWSRRRLISLVPTLTDVANDIGRQLTSGAAG
ncbi:MAG TPA: IclR family transcriptional regulator [Jatrophihabitantaceae bacterium]|jgi:DNA-binding IclR family transcriptional regulator